jgi:hypothetical protein
MQGQGLLSGNNIWRVKREKRKEKRREMGSRDKGKVKTKRELMIIL